MTTVIRTTYLNPEFDDELDNDTDFDIEEGLAMLAVKKRNRAMRRIEDWWDEQGSDPELRALARSGHRISKRDRKFGSVRGH